MRGRDPQEEHRPATPLELLFDLTFVVAVAQASVQLHHALAEGHPGAGVATYAAVFFAIWWAWMNYFTGGEARLPTLRAALLWGYGHYLVFAALAAIHCVAVRAVVRAVLATAVTGQDVGPAHGPPRYEPRTCSPLREPHAPPPDAVLSGVPGGPPGTGTPSRGRLSPQPPGATRTRAAAVAR